MIKVLKVDQSTCGCHGETSFCCFTLAQRQEQSASDEFNTGIEGNLYLIHQYPKATVKKILYTK